MRCTLRCTECTAPDGQRRTRQRHIVESTGVSGPDGRPGQISVIWGTEGWEFKSPQPDYKNRKPGMGAAYYKMTWAMHRVVQ